IVFLQSKLIGGVHGVLFGVVMTVATSFTNQTNNFALIAFFSHCLVLCLAFGWHNRSEYKVCNYARDYTGYKGYKYVADTHKGRVNVKIFGNTGTNSRNLLVGLGFI